MTRGRSAPAGLAALALVLAGCGGTSDAEKRASVDLGWRTTVDAADDAAGRLPGLFPDLDLVRVAPRSAEDESSDCSDSVVGDAVDQTDVRWTSLRDVRVEPPQETASLADGLAASLVADGWETAGGPETSDDGRYTVVLHRDGFVLSILGRAAVQGDGSAMVRVIVYSPCFAAPEDMGDWTPPTDAPTPSGVGSTS